MDEKNHLLNVFKKNGYNKFQGFMAFLKASEGPRMEKEVEVSSNLQILFIKGTTDKIARILRKRKIASTFRPLKTIRSSLRSLKDPIDLKCIKGVYLIPFSYGTPYIGEIGHSISQRI